MKALKYIGLGGLLVLLTIGCSDFLKEYSQDTYYVSSYEDLDELLAGDGYLPVNGCGSNMGYFIHFLADEIEEQNSYYSAWGGGFASGTPIVDGNVTIVIVAIVLMGPQTVVDQIDFIPFPV